MKTKLILTFFVVFVLYFDCFSQKSPSFRPTLWVYNHQKVNDTTTALSTLNFHTHINASGADIWSSSKKINNSNHLFLVYKSEKGKEEYLISILGENNSLFLDGKNQVINDSIKLSGYNEAFGELADISFSNIENGRFWMNADLKNTNLYELILVNGSGYDNANEIRTYLSLKYGIDLIDYKKYVYKDKRLWEGTQKAFNHAIFGIGYASYFNLWQEKSIHSKDQDLMVSFSDPEKIFGRDGSFVLLGNNKKEFAFDKKTKRSKKIWLARTAIQNVEVNLAFPEKLLQGKELSDYELIVQRDGKETVFEAVLQDGHIAFKNIPLIADTDHFFQFRIRETELQVTYQADCRATELLLKNNNKLRDFSLLITDDKKQVVLSTNQYKENYTLPTDQTTFFNVTIAYNGKSIQRKIPAATAMLKQSSLKEYYILEQEPVSINLNTEASNKTTLNYQWLKNGKEIGTGTTIQLTEEGTYELITYQSADCFVKQSFGVLKQNSKEAWAIYPNPATDTDEVYVRFDLPDTALVEIAIYEINGKLIHKKALGNIQQQTHSLGRFSTGTYIVVAYINKELQIKKIRIK